MYRALVLLLVACGPGPLQPAEVDLGCTPQYEPTYHDVWSQTLRFDCGIGGCHRGDQARGSLDLSNEETARDELLEPGQDRVIPGDPEHSLMIMRVFTDIEEYQMPPGSPLSDAEQCALALWVADGAEGTPPDAGVDVDAAP